MEDEPMFVCSRCARRQTGEETCTRCRTDSMYDLRSRRGRELLEEIELRFGRERGAKVNAYSAAIGVVVIVAAWFIPGYWKVRGQLYPGIPLLLDQVAIMIVIALGARTVLERMWPAQRFPFVATLPPPDRA